MQANTVLERQATLTNKRQKKVQTALKQEQDWWRDKDLISIATEHAHLWAAIFGSIGTLAAMSQVLFPKITRVALLVTSFKPNKTLDVTYT